MSLEESLKENTASIRELIKVISGARVTISQEQQTVTTLVETEGVLLKGVNATPPEVSTAKVAEKPAPVAKPAITPADIQKAATMVVKEKGRPAVDPVLEKYKLDRFVDAKPDIFEALYADLVELRGAK